MIAIIDYKAGNTGSVQNALKRLGVKSVITSNPDIIKAADGVIFPGQGRAGSAMTELHRTGLDIILPELKQPFLGICLGMQLLADSSNEDDTISLGIIQGECKKFPSNLKIPQLGWNKVNFITDSVLTKGIANESYFYFVHSYYFDAADKFVTGTTSYGFDFPSIVQMDNFYAVQFHPEKSGETGEKMLRNFCEVSKCM